MTRPCPPGERPSEANRWMSVRVRIQNPLPQGDGDHGDTDSVSVPMTVRPAPDELGYGHGV